MIRPYQPGDCDVVLSIWRETSEFAHPFLSPAFLDTAQAMIRDVFLEAAQTWITETDGRPVGFISVIGAEIGGLFVLPDYHGRGLGRALVDRVVTGRDRLELDVFRENRIGRAFYRRYGFGEIGRRLDDMSGHPVIRLAYVP